MTVTALLLAAAAGGVVGVVSGLLGIGGGIVMVPLLYLFMGGADWSGLAVEPAHEAALAHATSLFVIFFTALSGLRAYRREGAVTWTVVVPLGAAAAVAALVGSQVAAGLPSPALKALFGAFLVAVGIRLARGEGPGEEGAAAFRGTAEGGGARLRWWGALAAGGAVGFLSALLGVGGGIVAIPILVAFAHMGLHRVVPASIGIIAFAAPAGVLGYMFAGRGLPGLPPGSMGFVHLPTALAMLPGAVLLAPVGARLNRVLSRRALARIFSVGMLLLGAGLLWEHGRAFLGGG